MAHGSLADWMHRETGLAGSQTSHDSWAATSTGGLAWLGLKLARPVLSRPAGNRRARERAAGPSGLRNGQAGSAEVALPLLLF